MLSDPDCCGVVSVLRAASLPLGVNQEVLLQICAVGGNQRGRTFFKQHGWTELGSDKIEQKVSCTADLWARTPLSAMARNSGLPSWHSSVAVQYRLLSA